MDDILLCGLLSVGISVIGIIIWCIKEQRNIFDSLSEFFIEWWQYLKQVIPPLAIIILALLAIFH